MTAARPDTWMPLYIGDYLRDTMHLTTEQHGAYALLLMASWTRGGYLPDDDAQLAGIARMTPKAWKAARPVLAPFFMAGEQGTWAQGRLLRELGKAKELTEKKAAAGRKGSQKRWQDDDSGNGKHDGTAMAQPSASHKQTDAPSQSQSQEPIGSKNNVHFDRFWDCYPRKQAKPNARKALDKALKKTDIETIMAGLETYIATKPDYQDWAMPATWLNAERWNDEPETNHDRKTPGRGSADPEATTLNRRRGIVEGLGLDGRDSGEGRASGPDVGELAHRDGVGGEHSAVDPRRGTEGAGVDRSREPTGEPRGNGGGPGQAVLVRGEPGERPEGRSQHHPHVGGSVRGSATGPVDGGRRSGDSAPPVQHPPGPGGDTGMREQGAGAAPQVAIPGKTGGEIDHFAVPDFLKRA